MSQLNDAAWVRRDSRAEQSTGKKGPQGEPNVGDYIETNAKVTLYHSRDEKVHGCN